MSDFNNIFPVRSSNANANAPPSTNNSADVLRQMAFNMQAGSTGQSEFFNAIREKFREASGNRPSLMVSAMDCAENIINSPPSDEPEDDDD